MSDDVRDRAREALIRTAQNWCEPEYGYERCRAYSENRVNDVQDALDAAGIALVDANCECVSRGYTDHVETRMRNDASTIAILRENHRHNEAFLNVLAAERETLADERRRLLAFRDAVDGFETALGVYENCMDAHCGVGGFCDDQQRQLAEAIQRKGMARAAVAGIESEGDHGE